MKRILTRSQYLENLKNTQYDNITRINEMLENETKWGDSLLGRLIFSTIRSAKSGYKTKKIEGILKDLQTQLDIIISASLTRDSAAIFNETYIKSTLEEIKNVCLSTETDEEKLKQLIGWDGKQYMWDPAEQKTINPDSPGRRIDGVDNIMQNIIDRITEKLPNLESLFGMNRNAILDSLSDFTIELRKLTVELLGGTPGGNTTTIRSFPDIFGKAKEKINKLEPQNASYIFHRTYYEFLRESENKDENTKTLKDLKDWFSKIDVAKFKKVVDFIESDNYKEFKNIYNSLSEGDKETLKKDEDIKEFMEEIKKHSPSSSEETDKTEVKSQFDDARLKKDSSCQLLQKLSALNKKTDKSAEDNKNIEKVQQLLTKRGINSDSYDKEIEKCKKGPETNTNTNPTTGSTGSNSISGTSSNFKQNSSDSYRYYSFDELIRENVGPGGTPSTTPRTVESIWKDFFEKQDKKEPFRLTQREIEELKKGDKLKVDDLFLDVKKNPDPILALVRIWTRAHNLYFTKLIPSGRTNGAVSQATYLKYVHLGSDPGKPDSPGLNWALKSVWDKWTDGVLKILQDQKYRKVLANIKFKVAGAEDSFNKVVGESVKLIVERESETETRTPRDDGRNLFKFMNDLLEPETAGKFETERKKLLNLYFGIDAKEKSLGNLAPSNPVNNEPRKDDIEANSLVWKPYSILNETKKFNDLGQSEKEKGSYFALPLQSENKGPQSMLFFIVIDKVKIQSKDCNIIKFVFGDEEKLIGKSIKEHDNKKYENHKYPNWKIQGTTFGDKLHYGIIHMDDNNLYRLVHVNVTDNTSIETKKYKEISNISKMVPAKMVEYDSNKNQQKFNILDIKIDGKDNATLKSNHYADLKKKMENELK